MEALFREAQALASRCEHDRAQAGALEEAARLEAIAAAQDLLLAALTEGLAERVLQAAREGKHELDLLAFQGSDTFDGEFCYLYLLKGPRQREEGVHPLLPRLRRELSPFVVRHVWKAGTVQNRVVVAWA